MEMTGAYYGYLETGFFIIGFVKIGDELVRVGFYKSLRQLEDEIGAYHPHPRLDPSEFQGLIRDLRPISRGCTWSLIIHLELSSQSVGGDIFA